ncbi:hypothetical protein C3495_13755 (plasmid) [Clostridiaceae bacterium 14S0207]|nr:hypothetical protein C3495_13755 [Clostridiaceae bacterium 14S0207]
MKRNLISKLLITSMITTTSLFSLPIITHAGTIAPSTDIEEPIVAQHFQGTTRTAYNWTVHNLGVSGFENAQIKGPLKNGCFDTEGWFASHKTFTIRWNGAPSRSHFFVRADGQESHNRHTIVYGNATCYGRSGKSDIKIPDNKGGLYKLYVCDKSGKDTNIGSITVDSR